MALIIENKVVAYHLPKTGGIWVTKVLRENYHTEICGLQHGTPQQVHHSWSQHQKLPYPDPLTLSSFFVTRHPASWIESYWRYRTGEAGPGPWPHFYDPHITAPLDDQGDPDFNQFVQNYLENLGGYVTQIFQSFALSALGGTRLNLWVKQERLRNDLGPLLIHLGLPPLKKPVEEYIDENVSMGPLVEWDPELLTWYQNVEEWCLTAFRYQRRTK